MKAPAAEQAIFPRGNAAAERKSKFGGIRRLMEKFSSDDTVAVSTPTCGSMESLAELPDVASPRTPRPEKEQDLSDFLPVVRTADTEMTLAMVETVDSLPGMASETSASASATCDSLPRTAAGTNSATCDSLPRMRVVYQAATLPALPVMEPEEKLSSELERWRSERRSVTVLTARPQKMSGLNMFKNVVCDELDIDDDERRPNHSSRSSKAPVGFVALKEHLRADTPSRLSNGAPDEAEPGRSRASSDASEPRAPATPPPLQGTAPRRIRTRGLSVSDPGVPASPLPQADMAEMASFVPITRPASRSSIRGLRHFWSN